MSLVQGAHSTQVEYEKALLHLRGSSGGVSVVVLHLRALSGGVRPLPLHLGGVCPWSKLKVVTDMVTDFERQTTRLCSKLFNLGPSLSIVVHKLSDFGTIVSHFCSQIIQLRSHDFGVFFNFV